MRSEWINFFNLSLHARGTDDLIDADELRETIKKHDGSEAYHCAFDLQWKSLQTDGGQPTVKDYKGIYRPAMGYVWFDFDSHDGGELALKDVRDCLTWLDCPGVLVAYSGSKGFHLGIPFSLFALKESDRLGDELKLIAAQLKKDKWKSLDTTVFNPQRKFRALGSKHPKTGLFKIAISQKFVHELTLAEIRLAAKERSELVIPTAGSYEPKIFAASQLATVDSNNPFSTFAPNDGREAFNKCGFLKFCKDEPASVNEAQWYAALSVVARFTDGRKQAHIISSKHPDYTAEETNRKLDHALEHGPRTCENISQLWDGCHKCPLYRKITSPVVIYPEGKSATKNEFEIAKELVARFDGRYIRKDDNIFEYLPEGYWKLLGKTEEDTFKHRVLAPIFSKGTSRTVDSAFKTFFRALPPLPPTANLYDANPTMVNFKNGTLHVKQATDFTSYSLEFKPHCKEDYLNTQLPYNYEPENNETNPMFLDMLDRVFKGDADIDDKIRAVRQMFGAILLPAFPHLFFLYGASGTGKSTLIQIATKFVSDENRSAVEPSQLDGFHMASMLGKLVNVDPDVNFKAPIKDAQLKKVVDRTRIRVQRKKKDDVYGFLPAVHIYGGNSVPHTEEGATGAHIRRWTFLEFKNSQLKEGYNKEFAHEVFAKSPQGILNFALEGLRDILACRGHYCRPRSSQDKVLDWQGEKDSLAQFLKEIGEGEVLFRGNGQSTPHTVLRFAAEDKIGRSELYSIYAQWAEESGFTYGRGVQVLPRPDFYRKLDEKGFKPKIVRGVRYYGGFQLTAAPNSAV